jgi:uncharacterized membrane protein YgcG
MWPSSLAISCARRSRHYNYKEERDDQLGNPLSPNGYGRRQVGYPSVAILAQAIFVLCTTTARQYLLASATILFFTIHGFGHRGHGSGGNGDWGFGGGGKGGGGKDGGGG